MKNKKITVPIIIILVLCLLSLIIINKNNLVELNYNEIQDKIENKEDFVLCISASECTHCQDYKPKLKKICKDYNIIIYYIDIDSLSDDEYEEFKNKLSFDGSTPTTIFFKNGEETTTANRIEGNTNTEKIINKLKSNGFIAQ